MDLAVDDKVVVEAKAIERFSDANFAQLNSYLHYSGFQVGLLISAWQEWVGMLHLFLAAYSSFEHGLNVLVKIRHEMNQPLLQVADFLRVFGGAEGARTLDFHIANVALSQLSYSPMGTSSLSRTAGKSIPAGLRG